MFMKIVGALLVGFIALYVRCPAEKIVQTANGVIRGIRLTSERKNVDFHAFRGIPYAKPPLGDLRFKAPEPVDSWKPNTLDAFRYGNNCIQPLEISNDPYQQHEDCLYLNVFVPADISSTEKLAVMFFIHGGGYTDGSGNDWLYGPDFLMENRVLLVTINYRLGVLGFLSLDHPDYSGNMGLKDQQLALKWVFENIDQFGGDNTRITIFGQSAGAGSTHYHVLSTESQQYSRNAIILGGSVLHYSALSPVKNHIDLAFEMAKHWNQSQENITDLIALLERVPATNFIEFSRIKEKMGRVFATTYSPVLENSSAVKPFLTQMPEKTYNNSIIRKDVMFGITSQECLGIDGMNAFIGSTDDLQKRFDLQLPFRGMNLSFESPKYREIAADIRNFYFQDSPIDHSTRENYISLLSDINIMYYSVKAAKLHSEKANGKTFFYHFAVDSKLNAFKKMASYYMPGAAHGDDLCYVFRCTFAQKLYDEMYNTANDEQSQVSLATIESMTKIFTNFAKYGQPIHGGTPDELPPFESTQTHFLDITNHGIMVDQNIRKDSIDFWTNIERRVFD